MRPTVSEQLRETRRIMNDVILPELPEGYSRQIFDKLMSNLLVVEHCWSRVVPFLKWDNDAARRTLEAVKDQVGPDLSGEIAALGSDDAGDADDVDLLQRGNARLQALVQRAVAECGAAGRNIIHDFLMGRTARYPMRPDVRALTNSRSRKDAPDAH